MGQGALSKPVVQWWLSLNSSTPTQSELTGIELLVVACVVATKKAPCVVHARLTGRMPMRMSRWMRNVAIGWNLVKKSAMFSLVLT